jgi:hypothetical protein
MLAIHTTTNCDQDQLTLMAFEDEKLALADFEGLDVFPDVVKIDVQTKYYQHFVRKVVTDFPTEIVDEISKFAAEGYAIGSLVDARDTWTKWGIAKVIDMDDGKIKVHYLGWYDRYDEWFSITEKVRLAAPFAMTKPYLPPENESNGRCDIVIKRNLEQLGFPSELVTTVLKRFGSKYREAAVNALICWRDRPSVIADKDLLRFLQDSSNPNHSISTIQTNTVCGESSYTK